MLSFFSNDFSFVFHLVSVQLFLNLFSAKIFQFFLFNDFSFFFVQWFFILFYKIFLFFFMYNDFLPSFTMFFQHFFCKKILHSFLCTMIFHPVGKIIFYPFPRQFYFNLFILYSDFLLLCPISFLPFFCTMNVLVTIYKFFFLRSKLYLTKSYELNTIFLNVIKKNT